MSEDGLAHETAEMLMKQLKYTWGKIERTIGDKRPHLYEEMRELLQALDDGKVTPPDREEVREALRTLRCELAEKKPDRETIHKAIEMLMKPYDDIF